MVSPRIAGKAPSLTGPQRARANTQLTGMQLTDAATLQSQITVIDGKFANLKTGLQLLLDDLVGSSAITTDQQTALLTYFNSL